MLYETSFSLHDLPEGKSARVQSLHNTGDMRRRLQDLGLVNDTQVTCLQHAASGDPTAYLIRGAVIALRKSDAAQVEVEVMP